MTVRFVTLGDVGKISAGNPAPQDAADFSNDGEPFVRMQDVGREHRTRALSKTVDKVSADAIARHRLRRFPAGTLLIPKSGASINLNHRALLARDAFVVSHLATVIPDTSQVDPEYLYFWSLSYDPRRQAQTTSLPSLPTALIKAAQLPLPSLPEQGRIVNFLTRAEAIVRLRREAQAKAAELIPALFLDMFGDPANNPKGWPAVRLGDLAEKMSDGPFGSNLKTSHYVESGVRVIRLQNIGVGELIDKDRAFVSEEHYASLPRHHCKPDDVIIGTLGDPNLRAFVVPQWLKESLNKADCVQFRCNAEMCNPAYISWQ